MQPASPAVVHKGYPGLQSPLMSILESYEEGAVRWDCRCVLDEIVGKVERIISVEGLQRLLLSMHTTRTFFAMKHHGLA